MADSTVAVMTADTLFDGTEEFYLNSGGVDRKGTPATMRDYVATTEPANASIASQSPAAGATTYLTDSVVSVPATKVRIRTTVKWRVYLSKTAASATAIGFIAKVGTAGSVADTSACTWTFSVGTAAIDSGYVDIVFVVVGPLTSGCVSRGVAMMHHALTTTGLCATISPAIVSAPTVVNFDATTATKIGLAIVLGAAMVLTVQQLDVFTECL